MSNFNFPARSDMQEFLKDPNRRHGWRYRLRRRFNYFRPEDYYQKIVDSYVKIDSYWIDVGGGKTIFPSNARLSHELACRCKLLVGVDPDSTVRQNKLVHEFFEGTLQKYKTDKPIDLVTMRMVVEHVSDPTTFVEALSRVLQPEGILILCTPHKRSLSSIIANLVPDSLHPLFAKLIAPGRLEEDVFPTFYRMNTRKTLGRLLSDQGFIELSFNEIADCSLTQQFRLLHFSELLIHKLLSLLSIPHPERNIVAIYKKKKSSFESTDSKRPYS